MFVIEQTLIIKESVFICAGFLAFWLLYVIVVVASGSIYKKQKAAHDEKMAKIKPQGLRDRNALQSDKDYTGKLYLIAGAIRFYFLRIFNCQSLSRSDYV